jgi:hypothetical protein
MNLLGAVSVWTSVVILGATLLACANWVRQRPPHTLGVLPVAIVVFAFLYLVQPLYLIAAGQMEVFLEPLQVAKGIAAPALMFWCLWYGWRKPYNRAPQRVASQGPPARRLWNFGFVLALAGLLLFIVFLRRSGGIRAAYSAQHGKAMAWLENTAYLYNSPFWALTGLATMIYAASGKRLIGWRRLAPWALALLLFVQGLLLGSRAWTFAVPSAILLSWALGERRTITMGRIGGFLLLVGLGVLLVLGYRSVLHLGEKTSEAPSLGEALGAAVSVDDRHTSLRTTGVEFVFHAALVDTVDKTQKYHLGINWLYVYTVHLIPRIWWPGKPYGFATPGVTWDDIAAETGVRIAGGAAPGIVGDIYAQFGPLSVVFFYLFGRLARRWYEAARHPGNALVSVSYVVFYCFSLNCFAQGFGAILVPLPYAIAPLAVWWLAVAPKKRVIRRVPEPIRIRPFVGRST